jgi:hypothetical protein
MSSNKITIIVPVFNEENHLKKFFLNYLKILIRLKKKYKLEVVMRITNDASTDNSKKIINYYKNIYKKKKIRIFCSHNKKNIGKTLSNANQIKKVNSGLIFFDDSDNECRSDYLFKFLDLKKKNKDYHLICGYRNIKNINQKIFLFGIIITNFLINSFRKVNFNDIHCAQKLADSKFLKKIKFSNANSFFFDTQLCYFFSRNFKKKNIAQIKVYYNRRNKIDGKKLSLWKGLNLVFYTLYYVIRNEIKNF